MWRNKLACFSLTKRFQPTLIFTGDTYVHSSNMIGMYVRLAYNNNTFISNKWSSVKKVCLAWVIIDRFSYIV